MRYLPWILGAIICVLVLATVIPAWGASPPVRGMAPEIVGDKWFNTEKPITLESARGKVVVVHFWTFGCINCKHNLPYYNKWQKQFGEGKDFQMIGIHSPETVEERNSDSLKQAIKDEGIEYPVVTDNQGLNWTKWHQEFWPCVYLIDKHGRIRYVWQCELEYQHAGGYAKLTSMIKTLLAED